jgi:hypothetical protein
VDQVVEALAERRAHDQQLARPAGDPRRGDGLPGAGRRKQFEPHAGGCIGDDPSARLIEPRERRTLTLRPLERRDVGGQDRFGDHACAECTFHAAARASAPPARSVDATSTDGRYVDTWGHGVSANRAA